MKLILKMFLVALVLLLSVPAEEVMKITISGSATDISVVDIAKIVFSGNTMIVNDTYDVNLIDKIEFYDDYKVAAKEKALTPNTSKDLYFYVSNKNIKINLKESSKVEVFLYKLNGQRVSVLYQGSAPVGTFNVPLTGRGLSEGIYTIAVKVNNTFYAKKLVLK